MRVIGLSGWSGAGKTTLVVKLIPVLKARGLSVSTIKHAHHDFEVDLPGKDSYEHRKAGASEVLVSSARRWVQMHELGDEREPALGDLLRRISTCDLTLVEGFKREKHPKIEVYRHANGREPLHPSDRHVVGVVSDVPFPGTRLPVVDLNDISAVAHLVLNTAQPIEAVLRLLPATR